MPNKHRPRRSHASAQQKGRTIPDNDSLSTDDRGTKPDRLREGNRPLDTQSEHPDSVEIGNPVPEKDRTTRAAGETGEDEDLPDPSVALPDDGGTETDRGNVVHEPRNFDDSAR
jgi:hypothetical protein